MTNLKTPSTATTGRRQRRDVRDPNLSSSEKFTNWLARLGGGRLDILEHAAGDKPRFTQMGIVILTTAGIAAISAGFALSFVGLPLWATIPISIGWGFAIMNLDRLLIVSMPYSEKRTKGQIISLAIPRVVLALVIGFVISTPVTLQIFDKEIQPQLVALQSEKDAAFQEQLEADPRFSRIPQLEADLQENQTAVAESGIVDLKDDPGYVAALAAYDTALGSYNTALNIWNEEINGGGGTGTPGAGPVAAQKQLELQRAKDALAGAQSNLDNATAAARIALGEKATDVSSNAKEEVDRLGDELDQARAEMKVEQDRHNAEIKASGGILARLEALERLSANSWIMWMAHLLLAALFILIELLPVIMKTLQNLGGPTTYDKIVKSTDDSIVKTGNVFAAARVTAAEQDAAENLKVSQDRAERQRLEGIKLNDVVVKQQSAAVKAALKTWGVYAKKRTSEKVREYEEDLRAATDNLDKPDNPRTGFRPTAAPEAATYSSTLGFPKPD